MTIKFPSVLFLFLLIGSQLFSQELKTGTSYKKILGETVYLQTGSHRGNLQWQQSSDKVNWQDVDKETGSSYSFVLTDPIYIRIGVKEGNCNWHYSSWVNYIPISPPQLTTYEVTSVGQDTALYSAELLSSGNGTIIRKGICFGDQNPPDTSAQVLESQSQTDFFWGTLRNLEANTLYYLRAFAQNEAGISYGNTVSFRTKTGLPALLTGIADQISQTTAVLHGTVLNDGGAEVETRGFCWGTQPNPDLSGNFVETASGIGEFSATITGLSPISGYYYRAFALNEAGLAYGETKEFSTLANPPSVQTGSATNLTDINVWISGTTLDSGGSPIIETGICWSDQANPDLSANVVTSVGTSNNFNLFISDLKPQTSYYFRAYAANAIAVGYGQTLQITTKSADYYQTVPSLTESARNQFRGWSGIFPDYGSNGNGFSGISHNWDTEEIYIVGNNAKAIWVAHAPGSSNWSNSAPGSNYKRTIPLIGYEDPEAISYLGNGWILIGDESLRQVSFTKITNQTTSINKNSASVVIDPTALFNTGVALNSFRQLEGVAYDFHNKILYGLCEAGSGGHPRLFAWDWDFEHQKIDPSSMREVTNSFPGLKDSWAEGSDIHYSALLNRLYVVSGADDRMAEYYCPHPDSSGYGSLISSRQLPRSSGSTGNNLGDCEGICISADGKYLLLCFENESLGYAPLPFIRFRTDNNLPPSLYPFQ